MSQSRDLYLSFAASDAGWAAALATELHAAGLSTAVAADAAAADLERAQRPAEQAITPCRAVLALGSPDYARYLRGQREASYAIMASRREREVWPATPPGSRLWWVAPPTGPSQEAPADGAATVLPPALGECARAARAALDGLEPRALGEILQPSNPRTFVWRPDGCPRFHGRSDELLRVHQLLAEHPTVVVGGAAGAGKSMLVEEYALRFGAAYRGGVFLLSAALEGRHGLPPSTVAADRHVQLRSLVRGLAQDPQRLSPAGARQLLAETVAAQGIGEYLWVVDDVPAGDDPEELRAWLAPSPLGRTLLATQATSDGWPRLELGGAAAGLPTAEDLRRLNPEARGVLLALSWLPARPVPARLAQSVLALAHRADLARSAEMLERAHAELSTLPYFECGQRANQPYRMHPLLRDVLAGGDAAGGAAERQRWLDPLRASLATIVPAIIDPRAGIELEMELIHARHLMLSDLARSADQTRFCGWLAQADFHRGADASAMELYERQVAKLREQPDAAPLDTLTALNNLGHVRASAGDAAGALACFAEVVPGFSRLRGLDDAATVVARDNLAGALAALGQHAQAAAAYRELLAVHARTLAADRPESPSFFGHLNQLLTCQDRLLTALHAAGRGAAIDAEVFGVWRAHLSETYPELHAFLLRHAQSWADAGDSLRARLLLERAVVASLHLRGRDDVSTTDAAWQLFQLLDRTGDQAAARQVLDHQLGWLVEAPPQGLSDSQQLIRRKVLLLR